VKWVVFLRAVNVGTTNRCRPADVAKQLAKYGLVNIGAVGTFVVRENVTESILRAAIADKLPFECEIIIVRARDVLNLAAKNPFSAQPSGAAVVRFVNILSKRLLKRPTLPMLYPAEGDWGVKIIDIQDRFVLGLYRRHMKAIGYLAKIEKQLGVPATNRNWNTIEKVVSILNSASSS
jgi:uncharacterized protein (DUF1697 family)